MKSNRLTAMFMLVLILSPSVGIVNAQDGLTIGAQVHALTVGVVELIYESGESVEIYGTAGSLANVSIVVFDGYVNKYLNITAKEEGEYEVEFDLPEDAENGTYTVTVTSDGKTLQINFYVMVQDLEELAEILISQAEDSQDSVDDVFEELEESGIDISSEANENYTLGVAALEFALAHFEDGNYTEASDYALKAVDYFGDAFQQVQDLIPVESHDEDDDDDDEEDEVDEESLAVAIDRAFAYWDKLNDTVTRLDDEGYNVTRIMEILDEVYGHLEAASEELLAGNHTGAVLEFSTARSVLGRIHGYLQSKVKEHKQKQAEQFMEQFQRRIQNINGTIQQLQERLEAGVTARVKGILTATLNKLQQLRRHVAAGVSESDLAEALDELEDAVDDIENGVETLGKRYGTQIKSMNQLEAKIRVLNKTAHRLTLTGEDISGFQGEMDDAEGLLEQLRERFATGEIDNIGGLLEEAEESYKDARTSLQREMVSEIIERIQEKIANKIQEKLQSLGRRQTN